MSLLSTGKEQTKNDIKLIARNLLNTTHSLFVGPNTYKSSFARVVEGAFRRDYLTLYTMLHLAEHSNPEVRTASGTSCMDLSRRVLEDFISLRYMLSKGKEEEAQKFSSYEAVEKKRDMDYIESVGGTVDQQIKKVINKRYDEVKSNFLDMSSKTKRKGWDELADFLKSQGKIDQELGISVE